MRRALVRAELGQCAQSWAVRRAGTAVRRAGTAVRRAGAAVRRAGTAVRRAGAAVRWAQCVRDGAFTGPTRLGLLKLRAGVVVSVQARVEYIALELGEVEVVVGEILLPHGVVVDRLPWVVAHGGGREKAREVRGTKALRGGEGEGSRCHGDNQGHLPEVQQNDRV